MTGEEREALILSLEPLVRRLTAYRLRRLPWSISSDEIRSVAWVGAIRAVDAFDAARNASLATYAEWRIRSAIADHLREIDPLSRQHRKDVRAGEAEAPQIFSIESRADSGTTGERRPAALGRIPDPRETAAWRALNARLTLRSLHARAKLSPRSAEVLRRWMEGEYLCDIGASIGVKESAASQICSRAIAKLRAAA
jgi:RNA polymerase sigma factor (sigma-70 family)